MSPHSAWDRVRAARSVGETVRTAAGECVQKAARMEDWRVEVRVCRASLRCHELRDLENAEKRFEISLQEVRPRSQAADRFSHHGADFELSLPRILSELELAPPMDFLVARLHLLRRGPP